MEHVTWGTFTTLAYAGLMFWGYASQIAQLHRTKRLDGISFRFFFFLFIAVTLRLFTVGSVIMETSNFNAILLEISELIVFFGLAIISFQILWYRRKRRA